MVYESLDVKENETLIKENEYLRINRDKATIQLEELLQIAKEYNEVNLVDRLEIILNILRGKEDE